MTVGAEPATFCVLAESFCFKLLFSTVIFQVVSDVRVGELVNTVDVSI